MAPLEKTDAPQEGQPAPYFSLPSTRGQMTLGSLLAQGSLVLAFYTEDNTPT